MCYARRNSTISYPLIRAYCLLVQCEEERRVDRDLHVRPDHRNRILREGRPRSIPLRSLRTGSSLIIRTMKDGPE